MRALKYLPFLLAPIVLVVAAKSADPEAGKRVERLLDGGLSGIVGLAFLLVGVAGALVAVAGIGYLLWNLLKFAALALYELGRQFGKWARRELGEE